MSEQEPRQLFPPKKGDRVRLREPRGTLVAYHEGTVFRILAADDGPDFATVLWDSQVGVEHVAIDRLVALPPFFSEPNGAA